MPVGRDVNPVPCRSAASADLATSAGHHEQVTGNDVVRAIQMLIDLDDRERSEHAAGRLPEDLPISDLLRAADGAQRLARAVAVLRRRAGADQRSLPEHDPHDVHSLYS